MYESMYKSMHVCIDVRRAYACICAYYIVLMKVYYIFKIFLYERVLIIYISNFLSTCDISPGGSKYVVQYNEHTENLIILRQNLHNRRRAFLLQIKSINLTYETV